LGEGPATGITLEGGDSSAGGGGDDDARLLRGTSNGDAADAGGTDAAAVGPASKASAEAFSALSRSGRPGDFSRSA
jgi:hypothetical protein